MSTSFWLRHTPAVLLALAPAALAAAALAPAALAQRDRDSASLCRTAWIWGTQLRIDVAAADRRAALAASEAALAAVDAVGRRLSTWGDSELARLNRAPRGAPVEVSPALAADLACALRWARATGGAFDPTIGALVRAWGLRDGGRVPAATEIVSARRRCGVDGIVVDGDRVTRVRDGLALEEGGFAKGVALDAAIAALAAAGASGELNFGGQIAVTGDRRLVCSIAHPRDRSRTVAELRLAGGSVATSGNGERGVVVDGRRVGHLLDPRTGRPARDFGSVTVWTRRAVDADCLSTALYVMGPEQALRWASRQPEVEAVVVEPLEGAVRIRATRGLASHLAPAPGTAAVERATTTPDIHTTESTTRTSRPSR